MTGDSTLLQHRWDALSEPEKMALKYIASQTLIRGLGRKSDVVPITILLEDVPQLTRENLAALSSNLEIIPHGSTTFTFEAQQESPQEIPTDGVRLTQVEDYEFLLAIMNES